MQEQQGTRRRWRIGDRQPYDVTHVRGEHAVYRFYSDGDKLVWRIVRPDWRGRTDSGALTWPGILAANGFVDEVLPVELPDLVDGQPLDDGGQLEDACTEQCPMNVDNVAAGPAQHEVRPHFVQLVDRLIEAAFREGVNQAWNGGDLHEPVFTIELSNARSRVLSGVDRSLEWVTGADIDDVGAALHRFRAASTCHTSAARPCSNCRTVAGHVVEVLRGKATGPVTP